MRKIKKYRLEAGYTQQAVARALGKTNALISQYESGIHIPPVKTAKAMAKMYGCDWTEFYEEDDGKDTDGQRHCAAV